MCAFRLPFPSQLINHSAHTFFPQGFLNTCVYVYSNRTMMKWLRSNLVCVRFTRPRFISTSTTGPRHSIDRHVENGWRGEGGEAAGEGEEKAPESTTDSEVDDLDDDTEWLSTPSKPARKTFQPTEGSAEAEREDPHQVVNVLVTTRAEGENSYSSKSQNSAMSSNTNRKSILIPEKSVKNIDSKSKRNSAHYYPDVDSEKFVRFGK